MTGEGDGRVAFSLSFTTVSCDDCGITRFASEPGCGCDSDTDMADSNVEARRLLVDRVSASSTTYELPEQLTEPAPGIWSECADLIQRVLVAVQAIADLDEAGVVNLSRALGELCARREAIARSRKMRPWVATWAELDRALAGIEQAAASYSRALTAATAGSAGEHGRLAQEAMDATGRRLERFSAAIDVVANPDAPIDPVGALPEVVAAAYHESGATDLLEFDGHGEELYRAITGSEPREPGLGISLQVTDYAATMILDRERLLTKAKCAYEVLASSGDRLLRLVSSDEWRRQMTLSATEQRDAATEAAALGAAGQSRLEIRGLIRLGARTFEPISRPLVALILAARTDRPLERLLKMDPNTAINQLRDAKLEVLVEGLSVGVRDADAHSLYTVNETGIKFTSNRAERVDLTVIELNDLVLTGLETVLALGNAMMCALAEAGMEPDDLLEALAWGLSTEESVRITLATSGWTDISVVREGASLRAEGLGRFPGNPIVLAGACLHGIEQSVEELCLVGMSDGESHELAAQLRTFRAHQGEESEWRRDALFVEGVAAATFDGAPVFSRSQVRKWIAVKAGEALSADDARMKLRVLLETARAVGDRQLADSLACSMRVLAAQNTGLAPGPDDVAGLDLLIEWEVRSV
jgi:hypothetical protein